MFVMNIATAAKVNKYKQALTNLWKLFDPHPGLEFHVLHVQVLVVRSGIVGELHLHSYHVCIRAERLPTEAVLH